MANKKVQYKQNTALFFACTSLLIFGSVALYMNGGINYTSVVASSTTVVPAVAIMYALGWLIGSTMEGSKSIKNTNLGYTNNLLEEILKEEGLNASDIEDTSSTTETPHSENGLIEGIETESKE